MPRKQKRQQQKIPASPLLRAYSSKRIKDPTLIVDPNYVGLYSPWAFLWGALFSLVPICYMYIFLVVVRELFPHHLLQAGEQYLPILSQWTVASTFSKLIPHDGWMSSASEDNDDTTDATMPLLFQQQGRHTIWLWIEIWCYLEALFFILMKLQIRWLQWKDPLEASLSAAPLMDLTERQTLWKRMMSSLVDNPIDMQSGWFFDKDVSEISLYDVRDFWAWALFEGRHQEHLTSQEMEQLEQFVEELRVRISLQMYGPADDDDEEQEEEEAVDSERRTAAAFGLAKPKKSFYFPEETHTVEASFFSDLYESYRRRYDQMDFKPVQDFRNMVQKAAGDNFHPVQDFRNLMAETAQQIAEVEESARATASQTASQMYETLVPSGSMVDKQLTAMSHSTYLQMQEAWNSVRNMKERMETARFLFQQRQRLRQQLKGYRVMLTRMRERSSGVPSKQMAALMRRITECYEAMEHLEGRAQRAFAKATGFALKKIPFLQQRKEPNRFAKYSSDPLLGLATYPLCFHLLLLGGTEIPLRIKLARLGFERRSIGPVTYYYHPGRMTDEYLDEDEQPLPIVFVHGIGIGLISYLPLIECLLQTGRPVFLPEIPYVCGFRPWQSPNAVLPPAAVGSNMTAMLATHGFLSATWMGHSYGTSWLSYMVKFAPEVVASLCFMDPICFCLLWPRLTKNFVYTAPDPGTIQYIIRTDVIVNWTIQRSFPWQWIVLFLDQIHVPCAVFLSEKDMLVPSDTVEKYMRAEGVPVQNFDSLREEVLREPTRDASKQAPITCTIFEGVGHGDWTDNPSDTVPTIVHTVEHLCQQAESFDSISADDS